MRLAEVYILPCIGNQATTLKEEDFT